MLIYDYFLSSDSYNSIVKAHLWETRFYHVSQIGVVQCKSAMINALIKRWRPETHTFYFPVGECAVSLEDVAMILDLPTNRISVTRPTMSSFEALEAECLHHFGVAPRKTDCRGSFIKLRATRVDCKKIDGSLTLLLTWAWIHLPFLALIPGNPRVFPIANRWRNWERENYAYRYHTLAHYRRLLDDLQEGHAYVIDLVESDVIPVDIRQHSVVWSATMPLISFECVEWHASDRFRRQFGLMQGVPNQERDLGASHGEVLTGPKNQDWFDIHSFWVMQWTNRYSHILANDLVPLHYPLEIYRHWYRGTFGAHLQISDLVFQEDPEGHPLLGFMAPRPRYSHLGNVHDIPTDQLAHPSGITPARMSLDSIPRVHTTSENSGARMSVDSSRSADATRGTLQTSVNRHISMTLIQETNKSVDNEVDDYLVDHLDSDEDEDEDDDEDKDEDYDDDPEPSIGMAASEKGKGYNLRVDPPRRSATRYTPSAFNRVIVTIMVSTSKPNRAKVRFIGQTDHSGPV
ncbi:uncharacterized protein DS421_7g219010 [Arachis hypogaea]|nr:uncharacterized protein DS421_7g219010 [Arachis hypogaea]